MRLALRLGGIVRWRRRAGLAVLAFAAALPVTVSTLAFTADDISRPSGEQYASAVMGGLEAEAILVSGSPAPPAEVLARRAKLDERVRDADPAALLTFVARSLTVKLPQGGRAMTLFARPWTAQVLAGDWLAVVEGRLPQAAGEVAVSRLAAEQGGVAIGDSVVALGQTLRVVGVAERAQDLKSEDLFALPEDVAKSGEWFLEPRWLLSTSSVDLGPEFIIRTRQEVLETGRSLASRLPAPLVFGSLALLIVVILLGRILDREGEALSQRRLNAIGFSQAQQRVAAMGGIFLVVVCAAAVAAPATALGIWVLRQRIWAAGERVPPPIEIPWSLIAVIGTASIVFAMLGGLARLRPRRDVVPAERKGGTAWVQFVRSSRLTDRRRLGRWSAVAIAGGSLLLTSGLTLITALETRQSEASRSSLLPGQIRVASSDGISPPKTQPEFPDSMLDAIRDATGNQTHRREQLRVAGRTAPGSQIFAKTRTLAGTVGLVRRQEDVSWLIGRDLDSNELLALEEGRLLAVDPTRVELGAATTVSLVEERKGRLTTVVRAVPVAAMESPKQVLPDILFLAGPALLANLEAESVLLEPYTESVVTQPGGNDSPEAMQAVIAVAEEYGFPPGTVRKMRTPLDAVGEGVRTLSALLSCLCLAILVVLSASRAVSASPRDATLAKLGATHAQRVRVAVLNPVQSQTLRVAGGAVVGMVLVAVASPLLTLQPAVIPGPALLVTATGCVVTAASSMAFAAILARRNDD